MIEGYSKEEAVRNYGAALEKEIAPEVIQTAQNLVGAFGLRENEDFYVITDGDVVRIFPELIQAVEAQAKAVLSERGRGKLKLMVATPAERSAVSFEDSIGQYLEAPGQKAVLILTRMSRSWSPETQSAVNAERGMKETVERNSFEIDDKKLEAVAKKRNARIVSVTKAADRKVLTEGAILESLNLIKEKCDKIVELMRDVVRVHLTNDAGTDLWIELRPEFSGPETGMVDKPGQLTNFPVGEWYVLPRQKGTHGTLVIHDSPMGGAIRREQMDGKSIGLTVEDGRLVKLTDIKGEGSANRFRDYLESGRNSKDSEHGDPFRIAEFAIGVNTKAWRNEGDERKLPSTSVEAEKAYGTAHIAFGANGVYGQPADDPELTKVQVHADSMVLKPTVECFRSNGSSFFIIKEGEPQGY